VPHLANFLHADFQLPSPPLALSHLPTRARYKLAYSMDEGLENIDKLG
jgi:hypothetical protein